jgi:hypothetical protein
MPRVIWSELTGGSWDIGGDDPVGDALVVVSHDCDLVRSEDKEPRVEAMVASWTEDAGSIREAGRNATRKFLIQVDQNGQRGLIADASKRVQIPKAVLRQHHPVEGPAAGRLMRFRHWLGERYSRPPIPDEVVKAIQRPVVQAIKRLNAADPKHVILDAIGEIRFLIQNDEPPYDVDLLFIREDTQDGGYADVSEEQIATVAGWLSEVLRRGEGVREVAWAPYTPGTISWEDYRSSTRLQLDEFTLTERAARGEESESARSTGP